MDLTLDKGDAKNVTDVAKAKAAPPDASARLHEESNQIGMTGFFGGAARIGLTTVDGVVHIIPGIGHAIAYDYHHPMEAVKTLVGSAVIASALKTALPEAGPVGKTASVLMTAWFLAPHFPELNRDVLICIALATSMLSIPPSSLS